MQQSRVGGFRHAGRADGLLEGPPLESLTLRVLGAGVRGCPPLQQCPAVVRHERYAPRTAYIGVIFGIPPIFFHAAITFGDFRSQLAGFTQSICSTRLDVF